MLLATALGALRLLSIAGTGLIIRCVDGYYGYVTESYYRSCLLVYPHRGGYTADTPFYSKIPPILALLGVYTLGLAILLYGVG